LQAENAGFSKKPPRVTMFALSRGEFVAIQKTNKQQQHTETKITFFATKY
jgi:hypothetical protein